MKSGPSGLDNGVHFTRLMMSETLRRRPTFKEGICITLGNRQAWAFPALESLSSILDDAHRREYSGLLRIHRECEDLAERRIAELAPSIFLVGLNYELDARDLLVLFTLPRSTSAKQQAEDAFEALAAAHLQAIPLGLDSGPVLLNR